MEVEIASPGLVLTVAVSATSTAPATMATKNAYVCNQPRISGFPRSLGRVRVWVTSSRLRQRRLLDSKMRHWPGAGTGRGLVGGAGGVGCATGPGSVAGAAAGRRG